MCVCVYVFIVDVDARRVQARVTCVPHRKMALVTRRDSAVAICLVKDSIKQYVLLLSRNYL